MEPPSKRPRLSISPFPDPEPEPEPAAEPPGEENNNVDLETARTRNDLRLKSIFEGIFKKYGKDFTEVGDEIDLESGKIIVDNGHLTGMEGEVDTGENGEEGDADGSGWLYESLGPGEMEERVHGEQDDGEGSENDGDFVGGDNAVSEATTELQADDGAWKWRRDIDEANHDYDDDDRSSVDSLLDNALSVNNNTDPGRETTNEKAMTDETKASNPSNHIRDVKDAKKDPVDPIWRVPEISTPTTWSRPRPTASKANGDDTKIQDKAIRSASPTGAKFLWAVPRKTNTDVAKPKNGKKDVNANTSVKKTASNAKPKQVSSPMRNDLSLAAMSDGSESDDPLQGDYHPSPTPKAPLNIRGKHLVSSITPSPKRDQCSACLRSFASRDDYVRHLRSVLASGLSDGRHRATVVRKELDTVEKPTTGLKSQSISIDSPRAHGSLPKPTPKTKAKADTNTNTPMTGDQTSTPIKGRRSQITPDEIKLTVILRHVHKKPWKEIVDHIPGKREINLVQNNMKHWTKPRANPPSLSKPWSAGERDKLSAFSGQDGLTWPGIYAGLPGRSHAEIEFELLRLWVGEEVWNGEEKKQEVGSEQEQLNAEQGSAQEQEDAKEPVPDTSYAQSESAAPADHEKPPDSKPAVDDRSNLEPKDRNVKAPAQDDDYNSAGKNDSTPAVNHGQEKKQPHSHHDNKAEKSQSHALASAKTGISVVV